MILSIIIDEEKLFNINVIIYDNYKIIDKICLCNSDAQEIISDLTSSIKSFYDCYKFDILLMNSIYYSRKLPMSFKGTILQTIQNLSKALPAGFKSPIPYMEINTQKVSEFWHKYRKPKTDSFFNNEMLGYYYTKKFLKYTYVPRAVA